MFLVNSRPITGCQGKLAIYDFQYQIVGTVNQGETTPVSLIWPEAIPHNWSVTCFSNSATQPVWMPYHAEKAMAGDVDVVRIAIYATTQLTDQTMIYGKLLFHHTGLPGDQGAVETLTDVP